MKRNIILGCFGSITFRDLKVKNNLFEFMDFCEWERKTNDSSDVEHYGIFCMFLVKNACIIADEIYFDITHLYLPFTTGCVTLCELDLILNNYTIFNKTHFFINGNEIDKNVVKEMYNTNANNSKEFCFNWLEESAEKRSKQAV